jgi:hypothetical protein
VAAIAAVSYERAREALALVEVEWEELEPLLDPAEAVRQKSFVDEPRSYERGDVDAGFAEADVVVEAEYRTQTVLHNAMETHQSVARWEGDTLVIDVTGFNDSTWFDRAGNFHSEQLHVVERYTRTAPDVISYEATMEDPQTFTKPWKISMPLYRRLEKNAQLMDFKCVEFVEELMYGQWRKKPLTK